jgi:hypothetical protein
MYNESSSKSSIAESDKTDCRQPQEGLIKKCNLSFLYELNPDF